MLALRLPPESRCPVPAKSFPEYNDVANPESLKNADGSPHAIAGKKNVVWCGADHANKNNFAERE
jgi:hypothetical protein